MDNQNKRPPEKLEWNNTIYHFICNKANTLCYVSNPTTRWDGDGSAIIIEYRQTKQLKERFYVLYSISSYTNWLDSASISVNKISGNRMAKPL